MRWKELTNLNSIRRLLSALSALLNKRVMTWMLQKKKKPAVLKLQFIFKMQKRLFFWGWQGCEMFSLSASRDSSDVLLLHCS